MGLDEFLSLTHVGKKVVATFWSFSILNLQENKIKNKENKLTNKNIELIRIGMTCKDKNILNKSLALSLWATKMYFSKLHKHVVLIIFSRVLD